MLDAEIDNYFIKGFLSSKENYYNNLFPDSLLRNELRLLHKNEWLKNTHHSKTKQKVKNYENRLKLSVPDVYERLIEKDKDYFYDMWIDFNSGGLGNYRGVKFRDLIYKELTKHYNLNNIVIEDNDYKKRYSLKKKPDICLIIKKKTFVIYSQVDLWNGGAQSDRLEDRFLRSDFLKIENNNDKCIYVVVNEWPGLKRIKETAIEGYNKKALCYPSQLLNIVNEFK